MVNRLYFLLFVAALALAGCAGAPERAQPPVEDTLRLAAERYAEEGNFLAAAQLYLSESKTAAANQRTPLRLDAAEFLARGELWEQLAQLLGSIDPEPMPAAERTRYELLAVQLALSQHQTDEALARLDTISNPDTLPDHGQRYYQLRASAYAMSGNAIEAARQLIWVDGLIVDPQQRLENQYRIWEQLSTLTDPALQQLLTSPPPDPLSGWMELVLLTRQTRADQQQWNARLDSWRARYPGHAADHALLPDLAGKLGEGIAPLQQIAVLLPLSGRAAESADAIRDGILAAYYEEPGERPEIRFYDTGGDAQLLWAVYQEAIQNGADFVIGPLLKESIQQLALSGHLPVPVLALNQAETEQTIDLPLYQFGLAPEDEARQAAERAYGDGHQHVIALVPDTLWGERVFSAFATHFTTLGGEVLDVGRYPPDSADFKAPIQHALKLDASMNRHRALERLLGQKLQYEPRRRQDVDAIFILGFPKQARLISPQLRFHHAGDIPVYSTSHVFSANADSTLDRDINGLYFCDIPWVLDDSGNWAQKRQQFAAIWPNRSNIYHRLFALGFDAYQVIPWLSTLNMPGFTYFPGATGTLTLDPQKHLHRSLEWAQFHNGVAKKLSRNTTPMSTEGHNEQETDW